ncbi:uncharacterized protein LOC135585617 isoform X1 [Musa acuminata AAA Group]|uniref:uncharacterized protein LOC135585617 isoform X1 n=2 Tax=Musa acuminata AAA Group TaxID=214697 RepID=UPI0031DAC4D6
MDEHSSRASAFCWTATPFRQSILDMKAQNHRSHHHSADADSAAAGSTASAPRAAKGHVPHQDNHIPHHLPPARWHPDDPSAALVRLMCSYAGRILPRPHDNQLRYVGGETRIVAVPRSASFAALLSRLSKFLPAAAVQPPCLKYQLPHEDLDALVSLTSDEDVESMFDEYDRLASANVRAPRLRLFLFPPPSVAFGSVVDAPGSTRDQWFVDALNGQGAGAASGPPSLERGRSEASSIVSEVPDYLFGLDTNSPPAKPVVQPASSEPGSPFSASSQLSVPPIPDLPPVKTKLHVEETGFNTVEPIAMEQAGLVPNPVLSYAPEPVPVFYMPPSVHGGSLTMQQLPIPVQYMPPLRAVADSQLPLGFQPSFPVVAAKPIKGAPVYVGGPPIGPGALVGGGFEYPVGAESFEVPGRVSIPVYQATGVTVVGEAEAAAASPQTRVGRQTQ